ncbi:MAG: PadR family transcriptional regulator, partial [Enterococcus faecalis]|nr:PadR family transcriptional regulator [Enterococcus faecalis]
HAGERYLEEKLLEWEVTKDVVEAFVKEMGK